MIEVILVTIQVLVVFYVGYKFGKTGEIKLPKIKKSKSYVGVAPTYADMNKKPEEKAANKLLKFFNDKSKRK